MRISSRGLLLAGVACVFIGCGKHDLRLAFHKGDVHILRQESDRTIRMEGRDGAATHHHAAVYRMTVTDTDAEGNATIQVTIDDMTTTMGVPDSWGTSEQPEETIAVLAKGLSFELGLTRDGKVSGVSGAEDLVNTITKSLERPGLDEAKARRVVEQQFSEASLKEMFENMFAYVPATPVGEGATWADTQYHTTGMPFRSEFRYRLRSIDKTTAQLDYEATVSPHNTRATVGLGIPFDFSGHEEGSATVSATTGWLVSATGTYTIESEVNGTASTVEGSETLSTSP